MEKYMLNKIEKYYHYKPQTLISPIDRHAIN